MKFARIDVREGLLSNSINRCARQVEEIEIDMSTARSEAARTLLERAMGQARSYNIEAARRLFVEASQVARRMMDGFSEAGAVMSLTMLMDGMTNGQSQEHYLGQALEAIDFEMFGLSEKFLAEGASREVTRPILDPRNQLRDLITENLEQYKLRQDSLLLAETKTNADRNLASSNWIAADNVAAIGATNATSMFGPDHWWVAVMHVRRATALLRQQRVDEAQRLTRHAAFILQEWTDFKERDGVFKREWDILRVAQADIKVMTA